jgi:hypothetical protein
LLVFIRFSKPCPGFDFAAAVVEGEMKKKEEEQQKRGNTSSRHNSYIYECSK